MPTLTPARADSRSPDRKRKLARVLLADSDLASRLSLRSILAAAGYQVDGAASSAEAVSHLDQEEYQLVLADLRTESEDASGRVLAYARQKHYRPATAKIVSEMSETNRNESSGHHERLVQISDEDLSNLLAHVAELIGDRASRRLRRSRQI